MRDFARAARFAGEPSNDVSSAFDAAVFSREGSAWSEVTQLDASSFRVRLGGLFRTDWMASLCRGLATYSLSIHQAHASRSHDGSWIVELKLEALPGAPDPRTVRYTELANTQDASSLTALRLESFRLTRSLDHGGTLLLELEAQDSLGLLGALLVALAQLELFPLEMHIETRSGRAHDSLWLGPVGFAPPSDEAYEALSQLLARSLRA